MKKLEKKIKKRYILFISTIVLIIIAVLIIIQNSINLQKHDAFLINKSGKQRMLSQSISKIAFSIDNNLNETLKLNTLNSLKIFTDELENSHNYLYSYNKEKGNNTTIDSLLKISEPYLKKISTSSRNIFNNPDSELIKRDLVIISEAEPSFLLTMNLVVSEYQKNSEANLQNLKQIIYFLAVIAALILIGEFLFVLLPALKQLFKRNQELIEVNNELAKSENRIKANMLELTKLKTDLESKDKYNKIFIEQAPTSIAMLDKDMKYIAVSRRWISDYKLEGQEIIGRSHYDLFPEIGEDWKENHRNSLNGYIDTCDEARFIRADGSVQWIFWDVRPWYISEGNVGGLIMHTGDITHIKEKDKEKARVEKILDRTNEIARIGTWEVDLIKNKIFWSRIVREIHEVPDDYEPDLETAINFYKEGQSRDTIKKAVNEAIENGTSYDVEVELVTANGNIIWTRAIGQAEFVEGKCMRLIGVFQDINSIKTSQIELNSAHTQLKAIFNSGPIAIVSTDNNGIINQFNYGAEALLGYSASEMIGLKEPEIYHIEEELDKFRIDIAKSYGVDPHEFNPYLELAKNDAFDTREWTYRRKDGSTFPVELTLTAIKNEQGEKIGFLGVSYDITERIIARNELLRKNKLLNQAEKISMLGHWQLDTVADIGEFSSNLFNMFEFDRATIDSNFNTFFNFVHPDDKDFVAECFQKAADDKKFNSFTHRIITTTGKIKTVQLLGEVITNYRGEVIEMIGTCQDITLQKMAENKFRGLLESAPDAMVIANEKGIIQLINKQAELLFGYSAKELFEKSVDFLIPERFASTTKAFREDFFSNPKAKGMKEGKEFFGLNKNGNEIPVQISFSPLQTEEGILVSAAIRDITVQKLAENELLRKNQLLNFAEEIILMGNWQWDTVANKVHWSKNLYKIFKLDEKTVDLNFDTYFNFVHPDDKEIVTDYFQKAQDEKRFYGFTHRIISADGKLKIIQLLGEVITNEVGEVIEMIGACQDVTEQRMAENKFRGLLESAPDAMVIVNEKGKIQLINKQAEILFGYSAEELFEKPVETLIPERFTGNHKHTAYRDGFFSNPKVRAMGIGKGKDLFGIDKNGKEIPIQISLSPLQTEEGLLVSAAIRDITVQKLAENDLLRKNQLLNFAEKITMMGNWQWDIITNVVKWSSNLFQIFGLEENTDLTYNTYFSFVHAEDKERVTEHVQKAIRDKNFVDLMHRIKLIDGTVKTIQLLAEVITNEVGEVIEMIGTCQDVTEQRMAENKFRGLLESAPDAMVIVNEGGKIQLINKQAEKLFGYSAEELLEKSVEILIPKRFTGAHAAHRDGFFSSPKTRGMGEGKELFGMNKKGEEFPIQISLSPLKTEEGLLVSAAIRDITTQKLAARKIIEAKESLEVLANKLTAQNTQLADFAHITSHNLRAPVSNLNSLLDFYNTSESEEDKASLFKKFEKVINHLTLTLNTLVEAIKTKNETSKNLEDITFDEVLNKTKEMLSGEILKTGTIITSNFSKINKISYNRVYLESIFLNLVGNAIKYRSDDRVPELFIESENVDGKIRLKFKDNGMGIDLERHGHKLFGLNKVFHRHPEAKGVGLFMTKTQIEAMGGVISATSVVSEGSTFSINF